MHKPYESCFVVLFKVYIKQSQIWDTLPTSKMEFFVTIGICKVTSCRLITLYTYELCCPMSAFICVSSLLVAFRFRWFHLKTSEMVLFVKITIVKVVFYWTMVLLAQFLSMNFLFFVSVRCWVHLFLGGSILLQVVTNSSSSFLVLVCTMNNLYFHKKIICSELYNKFS